jgi:cytochrome c oxidase subunit I
MTIGGYLIFASVVIFVYNFFRSMKYGEKAEGNLWNSRSPEWQVPSPMPVYNYDRPSKWLANPMITAWPALSMSNLKTKDQN